MRGLVQQQHDQRLFHFLRFEAKRTAATLVRHPAVAVDHVEPVRHAAIEMANAVVHVIDEQRHADFKPGTTFLGDVEPFLHELRLRDGNAGAVVARLAPAIGWMGFPYVHA